MWDLQTILQVFMMAVMQGIGEFLPISSSGHLLVLSKIFEIDDSFTLSILLHGGTLLSVLVFFARDIASVLLHRRRALWLVIVGTIPTVIVAAIILKCFDFLEESLLTTGIGFIATGVLLITFIRRQSYTEHELYYDLIEQNAEGEGLDEPSGSIEMGKPVKTIETTTFLDAIIIGLAQGIAAIPGLSRSGTTISIATARSLGREWAAEFSFFLSIPIIAGGALYEILKLVKSAKDEGLTFATAFQGDPKFALYAGGAFVSFIVGWISLYYLMQLLKAGKLHYFAYWLFLIGAATTSYAVYTQWGSALTKLIGKASETVGAPFLQAFGLC